MSKSTNLQVYTLNSEWTLTFLAAWRTLEKTINPAMQFLIRCAECKQFSIDVVRSVKDENVVIGLQCQTNNCGVTIKFEKPIDPSADDFPERFRKDRPSSELTAPKGKKAKANKAYYEELTEILLESE